VYDTKPGSTESHVTDAPPEDDTQILAALAALHMNVTLESKKWIFIGIVGLIVLVAAGIVVLLQVVANLNSRTGSRRVANKHFGLLIMVLDEFDSLPSQCIPQSGVRSR
jgi:NADH:ubiquinone oxidoreductase subunit H